MKYAIFIIASFNKYMYVLNSYLSYNTLFSTKLPHLNRKMIQISLVYVTFNF